MMDPMSPYAKIGATVVILALLSYTVAVLTEQRRRMVTPRVLWFLTVGVVLDITATAFMIAGSSKGPFTLHGALGYSSLAGMLMETVFAWRFRRGHTAESPVPAWLHSFTRWAYVWWLAAFVTGGLLVAMR
jgi:hypothetical protein